MRRKLNSTKPLDLPMSNSGVLPRLSLRLNFSWTLIGNVIFAASQWGMLVILSKLGSPEQVGQFALALAVTAPVMMFSNLALRHVQATDANQDYVFGDYMGLRLITVVLSLLVIGVLAIQSTYSWETSLIIFIIGIAKTIESVSDVIYGVLQQSERMDRVAWSLMLRGPLSLLALGLGFYLTGSLVWGTVFLAISWGLVYFMFDMPSAKQLLHGAVQSSLGGGIASQPSAISLRPQWHWPVLAKLAWLTLPLGIASMLYSLYMNIPRYFIEQYLGVYELGIFAAIFYLIKAGRIVVDALARAISPRLAQYYAAGKRSAYRKLLLKLVGFSGLIGGLALVVASLGGEQLLGLLYQPEYARRDLFVLLMIVATVTYTSTFLAAAATAARQFQIQLVILIAVVGSTTLASYWLIPTQGLTGAAIALIVGAVVRSLGYIAVIIYTLSPKNFNLS